MMDYTIICGLAGRIMLSRQELRQSLNNDIPWHILQVEDNNKI